MARLMSQARGGFYACAPEAVAAVLERLRPPALGECLVLDPCAGQGLALLQLADGLDGEPYGIELSEERAAIIKALLDEDKALCPADYLRTHTSPASFSLIWCNPPYDYATGGEGRVEAQFIHKSLGLLVDGGVLAMVCPEDVARDYQTSEFFEANFDQISALPFPEEVRSYTETIVLGRKRKSPVPKLFRPRWQAYDWLDERMQEEIVYTLPPGRRPKVWKKSEPTDAELVRLVAASPLRFMVDRPENVASACARPPMSISSGHRALVLASGFLDGLIEPPDEQPHVVRGTIRKDSYVASCETTVDDNDNETTRTVLSERPVLTIRVLGSDGTITNLE